MITDNKEISTQAYWDSLYKGERKNAKVDSSNTKTPAIKFDRFSIVVKHAEGPNVLGVGSGHAHIEKQIKVLHPEWTVIASDQSEEAKKAANYEPYAIIDAYNLPDYYGAEFNTIICTQAMEYMERPHDFLIGAKRVAKKLLVTVPKGEMSNWSQLRIYTEENTRAFFEQWGIIEVFEVYDHLILVKLCFS